MQRSSRRSCFYYVDAEMPSVVIAPRSSPADFDKLAGVYQWIEYLSFGPLLERCRFRFLESCAGTAYALVLGDGDGRFAARLMRANPNLKVDAVDASASMLAALQRRTLIANTRADGQLRTIHADLREWTPDRRGYDLIVSHFFLDCLTDQEVANLLQRIVPHLAPNATWIVSEFAVPAGRWRSKGSRLVIRFLYFVFARLTHLRVKRIPNYAGIFQQHGFHRTECTIFLGGLLTSEAWRHTAS